MKVYEVKVMPRAAIKLDGVLSESEWKRANLLTDFAFPWEKRKAPRTEFRAFRDDATFYFAFKVSDKDVVTADASPWDGLPPAEQAKAKHVVDLEDRVELFFAKDAKLKNYYCLEVDPLGRVHDYHATFHRNFDSSWSFPGLHAVATQDPTGYAVEGSIPLKTLRSLGVLVAGRDMRVGVYRAEFDHGPTGKPIEGWMSWVDPGVKDPDFHIPASFGRFRLAR